MGKAKLKTAYNSLIICPRGLGCETNLQVIMGWESSSAVRFELWPVSQCQTKIVKLKSAYNSHIICPRGLGCEHNIKSWPGNVLMWSYLTLDPSFKV